VVRWDTTIRFILYSITLEVIRTNKNTLIRKKNQFKSKKRLRPYFIWFIIDHMNETSKKRGRPRGSTSFTRININDLVQQVGSNATIVVSKKWLEEIGLTIQPATPKSTPIREVTEEPEEKIQFSVNSFS